MWKIGVDIAKHTLQWIGSVALAAASGDESLAASYIIGISAVTVAVIAVLAFILLRYAHGRADGSTNKKETLLGRDRPPE